MPPSTFANSFAIPISILPPSAWDAWFGRTIAALISGSETCVGFKLFTGETPMNPTHTAPTDRTAARRMSDWSQRSAPLSTTHSGETVVQTVVERRLVADCKVNPAALVGHVKITFAPTVMILS